MNNDQDFLSWPCANPYTLFLMKPPHNYHLSTRSVKSALRVAGAERVYNKIPHWTANFIIFHTKQFLLSTHKPYIFINISEFLNYK